MGIIDNAKAMLEYQAKTRKPDLVVLDPNSEQLSHLLAELGIRGVCVNHIPQSVSDEHYIWYVVDRIESQLQINQVHNLLPKLCALKFLALYKAEDVDDHCIAWCLTLV